MTTLDIENNKGLLFPMRGGKVSGAVRLDGAYYEVSNSSGTVENGINTINVSLKKLGGRKSFEIHLVRSGFKGEKAPTYKSQNFMMDSTEYQVVGWVHVMQPSGKKLISLAVNEVEVLDFFA